MMIDKLALSIKARLWHPNGVECAVEIYRQLMASRPATPLGTWTQPTQPKHQFRIRLEGGQATLGALLVCQNQVDHAVIRLLPMLNPTRTLVHAIATAEDRAMHLSDLSPEDFFRCHPSPKSACTDNGEDNAIGSYADTATTLGGEIANPFLPIFEDKLKIWALDAIAPLELGFVQQSRTLQPVATLDDLEITLYWDKLLVREVEVYCERRHGTARQVIERLAARMTSAQPGTGWHRYPLKEEGGWRHGVMSVGFKPTNDIRQVFYAKCKDRIRIENRFEKRVKNTLQYPDFRAKYPLTDILASARTQSAHRIAYAAFWSMVIERDTITVHDFADFVATVASYATLKRVPVGPVVSLLLSTGSLDKTGPDGNVPERLIDALLDAGVIERLSLARNRPGDPERYTLVGAYHDAVRRVQEAFQN